MNIPAIQIYDSNDICVYFCFLLNEFGELGDYFISELVLTIEPVNYFELMSETVRMEKKKLIAVRRDKNRAERVYTLLPEGKLLAEEFLSHIPLSIRENSLETGREILERMKRERAIRCYITYDGERKRYDLNVRFLNEQNGQVILDINVFAPDEEQAKQMKERFLATPSPIIRRIMDLFLKDQFLSDDD